MKKRRLCKNCYYWIKLPYQIDYQHCDNYKVWEQIGGDDTEIKETYKNFGCIHWKKKKEGK